MLRRRPLRKLAVGLLFGYVVLTALYVVGLTLIGVSRTSLPVARIVVPRANEIVMFSYLLITGGCVGSFLNVIAWRLPRGDRVTGHSSCPQCCHRLRARDIVPVFGWLWLEGRCRWCRLPIAARYPIVEAAVAISFALIGVVELCRLNLPYDTSPQFSLLLVSPAISVRVLITLAFHLLAVSIAWTLGLLRFDGAALPDRLLVWSGGVLVCSMITMPLVTIVPWQLTLPLRWPPGLWWDADTLGWSDQAVQAAVRLITALAAAGFWGRVLSRTLCPKADLKLSPLGSTTRRLIDLIATIAVIAIVVGWQATALVLTLASLLATRCVLQRFSITVRGQRQSLDRDDPLARLAIACPIALVIALVTWRFWWHAFLWPEETASRTALLVTFLAVFCIPLWLQQTNPDHRDVPRSMDGS